MPTLDELSGAINDLIDENKKLRLSMSKLKRLVRANDLSNPITALSRDLVDLGEVPYAKMRQTSTQTVSNATWTTITMDAIDTDTMGNGVDLANEHIVIRRSGIYLVMGLCAFATHADGSRFTGVSTNSSADPQFKFFGYSVEGSNVDRVGSFTLPIALDVGDTVELMGWQGRGGDLDTAVASNDTSWLAALLVANN